MTGGTFGVRWPKLIGVHLTVAHNDCVAGFGALADGEKLDLTIHKISPDNIA